MMKNQKNQPKPKKGIKKLDAKQNVIQKRNLPAVIKIKNKD